MWEMAGQRLPMFPVSGVLFPFGSMRLHVFEPRYRAMTRDCLAADRRFGVVLIERGSEVGGGDQRSLVGTRAEITRAAELADGRWMLEVRGESVIKVDQWLPEDPYPVARVSQADGEQGPAGAPGSAALSELLDTTTARVRRVRALLAESGGAPPCRPTRLSTVRENPRLPCGRSAGQRPSAPTTPRGS